MTDRRRMPALRHSAAGRDRGGAAGGGQRVLLAASAGSPARRWAAWLALAAVAVSLACSGGPEAGPPSDAGSDLRLEDLAPLHRGRDYFTLRERLEEPSPDEPPGVRLLRAATAHAFNDPERSNRLLEPLLSAGTALSDSLRYEARRLRARNLVRLYRYAEAGDAFRTLVSEAPPFVDSAQVADHRNWLRMTSALEDVPPQRVAARSATTLPEVGRTHVEVAIGDSVRDYAIDTGANLSVLIRSEAEGLGLEIREAGAEILTSTDVTVKADMAVADRVRLGGIELENVVFLVLPDAALTFPGIVVRGILGFPIVEALGEVRFRPEGGIEVPGEVPRREARNLSLHDLTPYVRVGYRGDALLCSLDTGSMRTWFWEPFYRRYRARVEAQGTADTLSATGAGGTRRVPGYRLEGVTLSVAGRPATVPEAHVYTTALGRSESSNVVHCNLGRDVLSSHGGYTLNFRSMSLLLD